MPGKACYQVWRTNFEIDQKYVPIKAIGKGAYGVVCSAKNAETGEKVRAAQRHRLQRWAYLPGGSLSRATQTTDAHPRCCSPRLICNASKTH